MTNKPLTPQQLADAISVKVSTLATWRRKGVGPSFIKCGWLVRYSQESVDAWLAGQTRTNTAQ